MKAFPCTKIFLLKCVLAAMLKYNILVIFPNMLYLMAYPIVSYTLILKKLPMQEAVFQTTIKKAKDKKIYYL